MIRVLLVLTAGAVYGVVLNVVYTTVAVIWGAA